MTKFLLQLVLFHHLRQAAGQFVEILCDFFGLASAGQALQGGLVDALNGRRPPTQPLPGGEGSGKIGEYTCLWLTLTLRKNDHG